MITGIHFSAKEMRTRLSRIREEMVRSDVQALISEDPANVRYASGFRGEPHTLFITADEIVLFTSFRSITWAEDQTRGIELSTNLDSLAEIQRRLPSQRGLTIGLDSSISYSRYSRLQGQLAQYNLRPSSVIENVRRIKSPAEIDLLEKSQRLNESIFSSILPKITPGMTERAVQGLILAEIAQNELLDGYSFSPIVASMGNAWEIHHQPNLTKIRKGDMVILDMGVIYQGYCSDMTRTICLGEPSDAMREIYDIVGIAQRAAIKHIRTGVGSRELDEVARSIIRDVGYGDVFTHGLGHSIGLETHDPALALSSRAENIILEPGMALTIEPGIYLENAFGVRTEDVVIVQQAGCKNITRTSQDLHILGI